MLTRSEKKIYNSKREEAIEQLFTQLQKKNHS